MSDSIALRLVSFGKFNMFNLIAVVDSSRDGRDVYLVGSKEIKKVAHHNLGHCAGNDVAVGVKFAADEIVVLAPHPRAEFNKDCYLLGC